MGFITNNLLWFLWPIIGLSTVVLLWAMFWDRAKGRERCRKCRYAMEGVPPTDDGSRICPECGKTHTKSRKLLFTHRRPIIASLAACLIMLGLYMNAYHWRLRERGWMGYVPTIVLIVWPTNLENWHEESDYMLGLSSTRPTKVGAFDEMNYRTLAIGLWGWQKSLLINRIQRSEDLQKHGDKRWRFLQTSDFSTTTWEKHTCQWCGVFSGHRRPCAGIGATILVVKPSSDSVLSDVVSLGEIRSNLKVTSRFRTTDDGPQAEVPIETEPWLWSRHSRHAPYFTNREGEALIQSGVETLHMKIGWSPTVGRTSVHDLPVMIDHEPCLLRRFDLGPIVKRAMRANKSESLEWSMEEDITEVILGRSAEDMLAEWGGYTHYRIHFFIVKDDVFIASTESGLDNIRARIQAFSDLADTDYWRKFWND